MKLGVITDIHNNIIALQAVLAELERRQCDQIICCGDIIGIGPFPEETVQLMMQLPHLIAVRGNHEKYLLEGMPTFFPNEEHMEPEEVNHHQWEHARLSQNSIAFLQNLPWRIDAAFEGCTVCIMHYCMDRDGHYIHYQPEPSLDDLKRMFAGAEGDIILYGHDHRCCVQQGERLFANFGSLGCPGHDRNTARAGIITIENARASAESLGIPYDADKVIHSIDTINYPDAANIKRYFFGC